MENDFEFKREIVRIAKMMSDKDLVGTYEGNLSIRRGEKVYVTPSGRSKAELSEGQIIVTDLKGNRIEGDLAPTSETPMHMTCYDLREDVGAVIHCHAPYATAYAQQNIEIVNKISPEFMMLYGKVPLLKYGTPGTDKIVEDLEKYINEYDVFLLANHGVLAVGETLMEAYSKTVSLELLLKTEIIRTLIADDKNVELSTTECEYLINKGKNNHGTKIKSHN